MADIFISYARADLDRVIPIVKALEDLDWTTFWDWRSIPVGKTWRQFIKEGIDQARCVLVLWSEKSIDSEWVLEEADHGKSHSMLVPALLDDVRPPIGFGQIQAATLFNWTGDTNTLEFVKVVEALESILGPSPRRKEAEEERKHREADANYKVENELKRKRAETKDKAEVEHKRNEIKAEVEPDKPETVKTKPPKSQPVAMAKTEPTRTEQISSPSPKANNALRFGVLTGVVVLLIVGIWLYTESQKKKLRMEVQSGIEGIYEEIALLKQNVAKIERPEQLEDLFKQKDSLNHQAGTLSEQATKVGLEFQLENLKNNLEQIHIQLANKEKELIAIRKGKIFVGSVPENATVKFLNIDEPFQQGIELKPGEYRVQVSSEGYETQDKWFELSPGEEKRLNIELVKIAESITARPVSKKEGWVYLGEYKNGTWVKKYFGFPKTTDPSSLVQTQQEVTGNLFVRKGMREIRKKEIIDDLKAGDNVEILEVKKWSYTGYWYARIKYED